jgi:uncharacterized membrane protein
MLQFIKTTILGGLLFLVPVVILIFIIKKAHELVSIITGPVLANLPVGTIAGIAIVDLLTVAVVLLICFLAGLWAKAPLTGRVIAAIESEFLFKVPDYEVARQS